MIFALTWQKVLDGTKRLTTRRNEPRYEVGRIYSVQPGRGKKAVATIKIERIYQVECAGDISEGEARDEGGYTPEEWRAAYAKMHGEVALNDSAWRIRFELYRKFV